MILVFSKSYDQSTNEVMRWLHHLGRCDVLRVNTDLDASLHAATLREDRFVVEIGDRTITSEEIDAVWFRRGHISLAGLYDNVDIAEHAALSATINAGAPATAMAIITRWRKPPDSS